MINITVLRNKFLQPVKIPLEDFLEGKSMLRRENALRYALYFSAGAAIIWGEVGYGIITMTNSSQSVQYPITRYVSDTKTRDIALNVVEKVVFVFSFADAGLATIAGLNIGAALNDFKREFRDGLSGLHSGSIRALLFWPHVLFLTFSFVIGSLAPWAGLVIMNKFKNQVALCGSTMFLGQLFLYLFTASNRFFSGGEKWTVIFSASKNDVFTALKRLVSLNGVRFLLASCVNCTYRFIIFRGLGLLITRHVFKFVNDTRENMVFAWIAGCSGFYSALTRQVFADYEKTFLLGSASSTQDTMSVERQSYCASVILHSFLWLLIGMTLFSRTLNTPVLFYGEMKNPEEEYGTKDVIISAIAILLSAPAAWQYCDYMRAFAKRIVPPISSWIAMCSTHLFSSNTSADNAHPVAIEPLLPAERNHTI